MKLTNKSLKLAGALSLALIGASPMVLSTAASAAPMQPVAMQYHHDNDGRGGYDNGRNGGYQKVSYDRDKSARSSSHFDLTASCSPGGLTCGPTSITRTDRNSMTPPWFWRQT